MKKIVITTVCSLAMTVGALAQGTVNWTGPSAAALTFQTNSMVYSSLFGGGSTGTGAVGSTLGAASLGTGFYFELLYSTFSGSQVAAPTTLAALAAWSDSGLGGTNNPASAGRGIVNAGQSSSAATVPWASGTTNSIMVVGWSANLGSSWAAAFGTLTNGSATAIQHAFFGESATGYVNPNAGNPGAVIFANAANANGLPIFSTNTQLDLIPTPEPATMALAGLGGLSLLAFRRRK